MAGFESPDLRLFGGAMRAGRVAGGRSPLAASVDRFQWAVNTAIRRVALGGSGSVLYLVLVGLLSLGIATALRDAAAAIGVVLGLLYLFPVVAAVFADPDWYRRLQRLGPMTAGLAVQATTDLGSQPIGPWAGLGVVAAWAAGALLVGGLLFRLRDA